MSMLTVWTLWEIMSVTVLQDTLEMEHTALVNSCIFISIKPTNIDILLHCGPCYSNKLFIG